MKYARRVALELRRPDGSRGPLWKQLAASLRLAIDVGRLRSGAPLPSTRALAARLDLSRTTVAAAYDELESAGYLAGRVGDGTYVLPPAERGTPPLHARRWHHGSDADGNFLVFFR